jgi:hypothetical protein
MDWEMKTGSTKVKYSNLEKVRDFRLVIQMWIRRKKGSMRG